MRKMISVQENGRKRSMRTLAINCDQNAEVYNYGQAVGQEVVGGKSDHIFSKKNNYENSKTPSNPCHCDDFSCVFHFLEVNL